MGKTLQTKNLQVGMMVKAILHCVDGASGNECTELGYVFFVDEQHNTFKLRIITEGYTAFHKKKDSIHIKLYHNFDTCMIKENAGIDKNGVLLRIEFLSKKEYERFTNAKIEEYETEIDYHEKIIGQKNAGIETLAFAMSKMPRKKKKKKNI